MKLPFVAGVAVFSIFLWVDAAMSASPGGLPLIHGKRTVAVVNGEAITLDELDHFLAARSEAAGSSAKANPKETREVLQRLVDVTLVVQEGEKMGLPELPEVKKMVDSFAAVALREELMGRKVANVKAPEEEAERIYKDATREWKLSSVMFGKEDDAKKMVDELKAGKAFEDLAQSAVAAGTAKGGGEAKFTPFKQVNPQVAAIVSKMAPGEVSPTIPIKPGFVVVKLEDVRYVDNPEERDPARQEALKKARLDALERYNESLTKKYVVFHKKVLDSLDLDAPVPGFEQLRKDGRVVAEIKGEKPITVGDLAEQIRHQLYHGAEEAAKAKELNSKKVSTLHDMIYKRLFTREAHKLGLDKTPHYRFKVKQYEDSMIFGTFVQKAVVPDVKVGEDETKAYYETHIGDYTYPEMVRLRSLAFEKRADAEAALDKLRKGTDFHWLSDNAEGQVDKKSGDVLTFDGSLIVERNLPEGVIKAISGSKSGDSRLYAAPEGRFYVLSIDQEIPAKPKPYEETRGDVAKKIFDEKLKKAMDDWITKLRAASDIKIYLKDANKS